MRYISALLTVLILLLILALPAASGAAALQQQDDSDSLPGKLAPHVHTGIPKDPDNEPIIRMQKEMEKKANQERQLHLKTDTDKLFQLATELKEQVDKSNQNILSVDVIKKADEIEKLAHSVKEKMRGED